MLEVMYNHQLEYDRWLAAFLKEVETTLTNMRDEIWTAVHALTESEGVTFEDCLSLMLCVLHLLPQIPSMSHFRCRYHSPSPTAWSVLFTEDSTLNNAESPPSVRRSEHPGP